MQSEISLIRSFGVLMGAATIMACAGMLTTVAVAADTDKSRYTLFDPTPEAALRDFAPDRPAKSTGPTTIDAGHLQYELDFANYTYQKTGTERTTTWIGPNPSVRVGLTNWLEVSANIAPWTEVTTKDTAAGTKTRISGPSDLFLRAKANVWGNEGGKTAFGVASFVKAGTAPEGIGNRATEGGILGLYSVSLMDGLSLTMNSEIDFLKNNLDDRYHSSYVNVIGLNRELVKNLTLTAELWSQINADPSGTVRQYSFDTALAWVVRPNVQLDVGANFGLNHDTPAVQIYGGIAQRF